MKLYTVIVLTRMQKNFRNLTYDVITQNNGKIWTSAKPDKLKVIQKVMTRVSENVIFIEIR